MEEASDNYIEAQRATADMESASDYLTDRVRCFVVTGEVEYVEDFYEEVNVTKRRDNAVETMEGLMGGTISMHAVIAAKGVFGVEPSNFVVKDTVTGVTLYSIDGKMTPEMLNEGSAGEVIMKEYIERNGEKSDRFGGRGQDLKK